MSILGPFSRAGGGFVAGGAGGCPGVIAVDFVCCEDAKAFAVFVLAWLGVVPCGKELATELLLGEGVGGGVLFTWIDEVVFYDVAKVVSVLDAWLVSDVVGVAPRDDEEVARGVVHGHRGVVEDVSGAERRGFVDRVACEFEEDGVGEAVCGLFGEHAAPFVVVGGEEVPERMDGEGTEVEGVFPVSGESGWAGRPGRELVVELVAALSTGVEEIGGVIGVVADAPGC